MCPGCDSAQADGCEPSSQARPERQREEQLERASGRVRARASSHTYTLVAGAPRRAAPLANGPSRLLLAMSPFWIWTQVAIVVFVVIGMVVAITKLA
jgi:hypothetical protein